MYKAAYVLGFFIIILYFVALSFSADRVMYFAGFCNPDCESEFKVVIGKDGEKDVSNILGRPGFKHYERDGDIVRLLEYHTLHPEAGSNRLASPGEFLKVDSDKTNFYIIDTKPLGAINIYGPIDFSLLGLLEGNINELHELVLSKSSEGLIDILDSQNLDKSYTNYELAKIVPSIIPYALFALVFLMYDRYRRQSTKNAERLPFTFHVSWFLLFTFFPTYFYWMFGEYSLLALPIILSLGTLSGLSGIFEAKAHKKENLSTKIFFKFWSPFILNLVMLVAVTTWLIAWSGWTG